MDAPYEQNLDEELEHPREVSNCCTEHSGGADFGCSAVNGEKKRARKPTLKVEFGWKHYIGGKFVHIKKGRGGGNQRVSMNRSATYEECLSKATGLFFPNQYCTLSDMETLRLSTYNNSYKINEEEFTVESFKKRTGLTLPRLYLETKPKEQANSGPQWRSPSFDTSYTTQLAREGCSLNDQCMLEVNNIGSSSASEVDSGLQNPLCDTGQVSSDLDSVPLLSFFEDPNLALPACGTFHTEDSKLTTAADLDVNTMSQDIHVSQHDDLDHSVVQRHTRPSGSIETNHSKSSEGPSAPGSDLSTVHQDGDHYSGISGSVQRIYPPEGRTEGGYPFDIVLSEPLPENVTSVKAYFCHVHGGIIAELTKLGPCLFQGIVPGSPQPGVVPVTVITRTCLSLGTTYFKYIDKEHSLAMQLCSDDLNIPKLLSIMAKIPDFSNQTKQQHSVQFLQLLVYAASQTGEKRLIEIIFSTSAGQIVFNSYKDRTLLPEDVARANGHDDLANYLQDLTTRFSKEPECSLKEAHVIDWSKLEAAVTAAQTQRCLSEEKSSDDSSENNSDTDYFADVETSSIELSRTSSEDNTSKLYSRTLLYGAMVKIGQIREGVKQKSYALILRDSHFDSTLPEVVKGLDYTLAFHLAVGSKNIPRHLHTANERFLASRERMIRQPTIFFYIFAELRSQLSIDNTIPGEWKSSDISVKQFGEHTNFELWVFTSVFRPTRKTLFVYFADRRDALPHNHFFEDEDCESHICCWKWKKSGNNSLKFTERLKAENQSPAKISSANPSTSTIAHNRTEGTTYPPRTVSLNHASSDQSAGNRNDPVSEGVVYEKRLADDIGPHEWKDLACALGFHQASIDNIQQEKGNNSKECCIEVLVRWLRQNGKGATAGKLAEALTKIGLNNLANRFPIKPSDTNRDSKENSKARELEDTVYKMSNRIKELEEEDLEDKLSFDMNPCAVSGENYEEVRERRISAELQTFKHKLATYVTLPLEVPEVKQDQLKTLVKLDILKILSEHLEDLYIGTREMISETCKCSEDLKREFYDFAYHGLHTDHNELVHRVKDLEDTVQEVGEEEKEELQKLKEFQANRQSLIKELEEKWRALFSPPERLPETRLLEIPGRGEKSTDKKKVKRNADPGARPKQKNLRDELTKPEAPLTSVEAPPIANFADRRDALPHNYFFEDEDWKLKKSGNNSLKFTERLKVENRPPAKISSANPSTATIAHNRTEGTSYPARTVSLNNASSGQSAWNRNDPLSENDVYEKRLADDIGQQWKDSGRALGFHRVCIDNIEREKGNNSKEYCIEVLVRWLRRDGKGATARILAEAVTKIELSY